ncbi:MAG: hypothetical protein A2087_14180 [Spirochaetes bacterium GWD1_61_31]|nr:MAG: hypothetical protein A2Y37_04065 [Spirochaetes bacterium GWB1_60_80]OHD30558.1 MAG: hypothetical protein A2004_05450 [Spirochaetes bacterium GWC1_61_12]OHD34825.1 MAG: hypothetical protein A2087_14180 [Spirochaetes bacterium GWD1_61_31]OHD46671.1 MAG: hypothetical protein A2Y35_11005 [Spirochaetes bacterium GWE1_60_18]OHD61547.1 MAG: hypothetical protein A2Y32_09565 [Spirochaetes bacterium GWF1_60_12]HAP44196.1 CTP pyrophosphohydrolase [Spirochaetaceae bacterium]
MEKRSVAGIAIRDGQVFVAQRLPGGDLGGKWEFPGGKREAGESDQAALVREYLEEFKLTIDVGRPVGESAFQHNGQAYSLAAWEIKLADQPLQLAEHSTTAWVPASALAALDLADSDRSLVPAIQAFMARLAAASGG